MKISQIEKKKKSNAFPSLTFASILKVQFIINTLNRLTSFCSSVKHCDSINLARRHLSFCLCGSMHACLGSLQQFILCFGELEERFSLVTQSRKDLALLDVNRHAG